jgi:hypothetical protein
MDDVMIHAPQVLPSEKYSLFCSFSAMYIVCWAIAQTKLLISARAYPSFCNMK